MLIIIFSLRTRKFQHTNNLLTCTFEYSLAGTLNDLLASVSTEFFCGQPNARPQATPISLIYKSSILARTRRPCALIWNLGDEQKTTSQLVEMSQLLARIDVDAELTIVAPTRFVRLAWSLVRSARAERRLASICLLLREDDDRLLRPHLVSRELPRTPQASTPIRRLLLIGGSSDGIGARLLRSFASSRRLRPTYATIIGRRAEHDAAATARLSDDTMRIEYRQCDVADSVQMRTLAETLKDEQQPLDLVVHCAGVVENSLFSRTTLEHFERVWAPKVVGTRHTLELCAATRCRRLVLVTSLAAYLGSLGNANYAAANAEMRRLADESDCGCETIEFALGPVEGAGLLHGDDERATIRAQIRASGWPFIHVDRVVDQIVDALNAPNRTTIVIAADELKAQLEMIDAPRISLARGHELGLTAVQRQVEVAIREISGLVDVPPQRGLASLGLDSLMIEQLRARLVKTLGVGIQPIEMFEHCSLSALVSLVANRQTIAADDAPHFTSPPPPPPPSEAARSCVFSNDDQTPDEQQIAIVGFAGAFPGCSLDAGDASGEFFERLLAGEELLSHEAPSTKQKSDFVNASSHIFVEDSDVNATLLGLSSAEFDALDPQTRSLARLSHIALVDAGYCQKRRQSLRIACITAAEPEDDDEPSSQCRAQTSAQAAGAQAAGSLMKMFARNRPNFAAAWIAHTLGLRGPAFAVYAACSSGLVAIANAVALLRDDAAAVDMALVGGAHLARAHGHAVEGGTPMASEPHARPFSRAATGIVRGSAAAVVLLRRASAARRDGDKIRARLVRLAVNQDAGGRTKSNFAAPSIDGQCAVIAMALNGNGDDDDGGGGLDYVECHATGTQIGDASELTALRRAFDECNLTSRPLIGSVKANVGHTYAASALVALAKCLHILRTRRVPPQINVDERELADEVANVGEVNTSLVMLTEDVGRPLRILINSFGIGGTNAAALIEAEESTINIRASPAPLAVVRKLTTASLNAVDEQTPPPTKDQFCLPISAPTPSACVADCRRLARYLQTNGNSRLADISHTLRNYRDAYDFRVAIVVENAHEAIERLDSIDESKIERANERRRFALYFGHQGLQYASMWDVDKQLCRRLGVERSDDSPAIDTPSAASVALMRTFAAQIELLERFGVRLDDVAALFGHSLGEYGAYAAAGALDAHDAIEFVAARGRCIEKTPSARMFAVRGRRLDAALERSLRIHVSAVLADELRVYACEVASAVDVKRRLEEESGRSAVELPTRFGFHTSEFMAPIVDEFRRLAQQLPIATRRPLRAPIISTVNGDLITTPSRLTADALVAHLISPVRLDRALVTLERSFGDVDCVIELGPRGVLSRLLVGGRYRCISIMQSRSEAARQPRSLVGAAVAQLWSLGFNVCLDRLSDCASSRLVRDLPIYALEPIKTACSREHDDFEYSAAQVGSEEVQSANVEAANEAAHLDSQHSSPSSGQNRQENAEEATISEAADFKLYEPSWLRCEEPSDEPRAADGRLLILVDSRDDIREELASTRDLLTVDEFERRVERQPRVVDLLYYASDRRSPAAFFNLLRLRASLRHVRGLRLFIVAAAELAPAATLSVGALEAIARQTPGDIRCFHVLLERKSLLGSLLERRLELRPQHSLVSRLRLAADGQLQRLVYTLADELPPSSPRAADRHESWLFVGGGSLARALIAQIRAVVGIQSTIVVVSRSDDIYEGAVHERADVTNFEQLARVFARLRQRFDRFDCTIFTAGVPPPPRDANDEKADEQILATKFDGLRNLIDAAASVNSAIGRAPPQTLPLGDLILCSSLSAVTALEGAHAYAAANCHLDQQAALSRRRVRTDTSLVLSVQLPPLRGTRMLHDFEKTILGAHSLDVAEAAARIFQLQRRCRQSGVFALSMDDPLAIRAFMNGRFAPAKSNEQPASAPSDDDDQRISRLAAIWRSCLASFLPPPGRSTSSQSQLPPANDDDFFRVGGNSLSALQLTWRVAEIMNVPLTVDELAASPTFGALAALIAHKRATTSPASSSASSPRLTRSHRRTAPLSWPQEQMLILDRASPLRYTIVYKLDIVGDFCISTARCALRALIERQKSLRTTFHSDESATTAADDKCRKEAAICQAIGDTNEALARTFIVETTTPLLELLRREREWRFDLAACTFRFVVARASAATTTIIVSQSHLITDGWSVSIFAREFSILYRAARQSTSVVVPPLSPLVADYVDFAVYNREHFDAKRCETIVDSIAELPAEGSKLWSATRITTKCKPTYTTTTTTSLELDAADVERLNVLTREHGATRFTLVLLAFARCLDAWRERSCADDQREPLVFGTPSAGREIAETAHIIGYFLNNMIVVVRDLAALHSANLAVALDTIESAIEEAQCAAAAAPFHLLVAALRRRQSHAAVARPIFSIFFNYRHALDHPHIELGDELECRVEQLTSNAGAFQLACTVDELDESRMRVALEFDASAANWATAFTDDLRHELKYSGTLVAVDMIANAASFIASTALKAAPTSAERRLSTGRCETALCYRRAQASSRKESRAQNRR